MDGYQAEESTKSNRSEFACLPHLTGVDMTVEFQSKFSGGDQKK